MTRLQNKDRKLFLQSTTQTITNKKKGATNEIDSIGGNLIKRIVLVRKRTIQLGTGQLMYVTTDKQNGHNSSCLLFRFLPLSGSWTCAAAHSTNVKGCLLFGKLIDTQRHNNVDRCLSIIMLKLWSMKLNTPSRQHSGTYVDSRMSYLKFGNQINGVHSLNSPSTPIRYR